MHLDGSISFFYLIQLQTDGQPIKFVNPSTYGLDKIDRFSCNEAQLMLYLLSEISSEPKGTCMSDYAAVHVGGIISIKFLLRSKILYWQHSRKSCGKKREIDTRIV